ncbi:MAG: tRNA (N(6)-L-threonylcarbamoyladenosine(37)-C(2))-methylthiotransferase MtaB [Acetivibrionales bacterium]|jgi:threonylcarbamoyladenosine tRNA methylthiotransferase MtaB|nr:tRNA (N(6)-L-threonylcarbamoyladenosine(37)-C(2))-methylthiotransferase MtaB [Clostridiaceae bacterium]
MKESRKVAFITLGCKVNIAETEGMKLLFKNAGYEIVNHDECADVYVVNTCTVTSMGDKKSRQLLRKAHSLNPDAIVAAVGCFAQVSPEEAAKIQGVNLVIGNNMKHRIVELVEDAGAIENKSFVMETKALKKYEELPVESYEGHTRAFLKVQDGCNQFCSYCIIPYARGPIRSRGLKEVVNEARSFAAHGFKEVVLTGIHLTSYGTEKEGAGLAELIKEIHKIDGIERIRLGSLEPMFLTPELIEDFSRLPKLCPHFHLSLQSGCKRTLKHMNRKYTPSDYQRIVSLMRERIPDVTFTTDVMVGFPGETEEDFKESYDFCRQIGFLRMHVFKYSPRKGTPAATFPGQVESRIKERRSKLMIELANQMRNEVFEKYLGHNVDVIIEQEIGAGNKTGDKDEKCNGDIDKCGNNDTDNLIDAEGLTSNYIPVVVRTGKDEIGQIVTVSLGTIEGERVRGNLRNN